VILFWLLVSIWRSWRGSTREYQWEGAYPTARVIARKVRSGQKNLVTFYEFKYLYSGATSNTISDLFIGESLDSTTTSYLPLEEKTCWREREEKKSPPAKRPLSEPVRLLGEFLQHQRNNPIRLPCWNIWNRSWIADSAERMEKHPRDEKDPLSY